MKPIRQIIHGYLRDDAYNSIVLPKVNTEPKKKSRLVVRYGLLIRGPETPIFPSSVLDDWGNEITKLNVYKWLYENGDRYPRATIFGFDLEGKQSEWFAREIEYQWKYPCYVYNNPFEPLSAGKLVQRIGRVHPELSVPETVPRLEETKAPFRRSRVSWWKLPTLEAEFPSQP